MVEAEHKINLHAHVAGLKRLSARANAGPVVPPRRVALAFSAYGSNAIDHLRRCRVQIEKGLSEQEFERLEALYQFNFPPDLRGILAEGLPIGAGFPDWRSGGSLQLKMWINKPKSVMLEEVEMGTFWLKHWGPRPLEVHQALRIARRRVQKAPVLVPVYGNCYIAASPIRAGNPVFLVEGGDVLYCGMDVSDFFQSFASWSRKGGSGFIPQPVGGWDTVAKRSRQEPQKTEFLSFYEDEDVGAKTNSPTLESWSRGLDALARHDCGCERKSSDSARSVLSARSSSGSDYSSSSPEHQQQHQHHHHHYSRGERVSMVEARAVRRIDFWSELCEKGNSSVSMVRATWSPCYDDSAEFIQLEELEVGPDQSSNLRVMEEAVSSIANRLRSGGWKESEISEIVEAATTSSSIGSGYREGLPDRQTVLEGLAFHLDCLSSSLRKAGWSVHDVAETMCLDHGFVEQQHIQQQQQEQQILQQHSRRAVKVPPETAARLGMLAAFVAQG